MKKAALITALAALTTIAVAEPQSAPPMSINVSNLPGGASIVDDVIIPVPSEIFGVLDKIYGSPAWREVMRTTKGIPTPSEREQTALLLGTVIAEGFIAVEAQDSAEVKNIGKVVITLADALNVGKSVRRRSSAIIDNADKKDWKAVRQELDKAQHDVQDAMREMNDENYAQLISLGGWLRGLEALCQVVKREYKRDAADLLHQPALVNYFSRRLDNMSKKIKEKPLVKKMQKGLVDALPLMGKEGAEISAKTVGDIHAIAEELNKAVHAKSN